jgi:hypothetical protein
MQLLLSLWQKKCLNYKMLPVFSIRKNKEQSIIIVKLKIKDSKILNAGGTEEKPQKS